MSPSDLVIKVRAIDEASPVIDALITKLERLDELQRRTGVGAVYETDEEGGHLLYPAGSAEAVAFHEKYGNPDNPVDLDPSS